MKKIINIIIGLATLCICYGYSYSQVNDNNTAPIKGTGVFQVSINRPLSIIVTPRNTDNLTYVKGTTVTPPQDNRKFDININYFIGGEAGKYVYIDIIEDPAYDILVAGSVVQPDGTHFKDDKKGVQIDMQWNVQNGTTTGYNGNGTTPHQIVHEQAQNLNDPRDGGLNVYLYITELRISPTALSGLHTFDQTITVCYNTF